MFEKYYQYGVIKICGSTIHLHDGLYSYRTISFGEEVDQAYWSGTALLVKFKGERHKNRLQKVRDWSGSYDIIWL